ncbi:hypothetical protein CPB86DRAFT_731469 [Serendipita vermifera]|nr:hypothetical protein CPB86DRAFT_731469 [Serendipita vermifera]
MSELESQTTERQPITRVSKTFCEGYGDFALQSCDEIVFYISRFLLAYTSPVFRDMFDLGGTIEMFESIQVTEGMDISDAKREVKPIQVSEDAHTLDLILRHIDPKQVAAPINEATIEKLLEAARKYQLPTIMAWFSAEAMKHVEHPNNPIPGRSLMARNPLLVLSLATEYEMPILAQQAVCAIVTGEVSLLQKDVNIRLDIYRRVYALREERINWFLALIGSIAGKVYRGKPVMPAVCQICLSTRSAWVHKLMETVLHAPKWKSFEQEVFSPARRCKPGCGDWGPQVQEDMLVWAHEAVQKEAELPTLAL